MLQMLRILFLVLMAIVPAVSSAQSPQVGDPFPAFEMKNGLNQQDFAYLGLSGGSLFTRSSANVNDVKAELLLVEFLNKYCGVCQKEAPEFNRFFQEIEKDQKLKGRVKILGVAIGNSAREVENFKKEHAIPFPIFPDTETIVYRKIGSPGGSPLVYILRKAGNRWLIVDGVKGETRAEDLVLRAKAGLLMDAGKVPRAALWEDEPSRKTGEAQVRTLIASRIPGARIVKGITFHNGDLFVIRKGNETLFAKAEARKVPCAVCHDATFIYVFDRNGTIRDFIPVSLSKEGNRPFSGDDVERLRKNLVGRNILTPFKFEREVDAVTSATLTSLVIYDSVHHSAELLKIIEKEGY